MLPGAGSGHPVAAVAAAAAPVTAGETCASSPEARPLRPGGETAAPQHPAAVSIDAVELAAGLLSPWDQQRGPQRATGLAPQQRAALQRREGAAHSRVRAVERDHLDYAPALAATRAGLPSSPSTAPPLLG